MIVIDKHVILVHMQKCGGTAVASAILNQWDGHALYWGYDTVGENRSQEWFKAGLLWKHSTAWEARRYLPEEVWKRTPKVLASFRPARERLLSHYAHVKRWSDKTLTFSQYMKSNWPETLEQYITDRSGEILVDHIIDFQSLEASAKTILQKCGIELQHVQPENVNSDKKNILSSVVLSDEDEEKMDQFSKWESDLIEKNSLASFDIFAS